MPEYLYRGYRLNLEGLVFAKPGPVSLKNKSNKINKHLLKKISVLTTVFQWVSVSVYAEILESAHLRRIMKIQYVYISHKEKIISRGKNYLML